MQEKNRDGEKKIEPNHDHDRSIKATRTNLKAQSIQIGFDGLNRRNNSSNVGVKFNTGTRLGDSLLGR